LVQDGFVGQHIELLLHLALDVGAVQRAEIAAQRALGDHRRNGFDGGGDVDQQGAELAVLLERVLLDDEFREGRASELHDVSNHSCVTALEPTISDFLIKRQSDFLTHAVKPSFIK
jgi:hypothetical protein